MWEDAWLALCRTRDSEKPPTGATGFAVPVAGRPSRYRSRSRLRVPRRQERHRQSAVLSGGARVAPSTVPDCLPPFVATVHRQHVLSVRRPARVLQLWFCQSSSTMTETPTDLRREPSDHPGKRCYPGLAAPFGAAVRSDCQSLREATCLDSERIDHRNQIQDPDGVPSIQSKRMNPTFAQMRR